MAPSARHLILNLLLGAGGAPLSARQAVASCALFGIRENSARVALARLASAGLVVAAGRGSYVLGPPAEALAADVAQWRSAEQRVGDWHGGWIAVHVAGLGRSDRAALRARERALGMLGLAELERGLYLRPDNLAQGATGVRERLGKLGLGSDVAVFAARDFDPARERQARRLWDGAALNRRYRKSGQRLATWLDRSRRLEPEAAAREAFLLGHEAIRELVFDPLLPDPLVDVQARRAYTDAVLAFDAAGQALWQRFLATA